MYCANCGSKLADEAKFCWSCGRKIEVECDDFAENLSEEMEQGIFVIEDVFYISSRGFTIGVGYVEYGEIHINDEVEIVRNEKVINYTKITGIDLAERPVGSKQGVLVDMVLEGDEKMFQIGLLLRDIKPSEVRKGDVLVVKQRYV